MSSHYSPNTQSDNSIQGLAVFPTEDSNNTNLFVTCGYDGTLRIWSISKKKQLNFVFTNENEKGEIIPVHP